MAQSETLSTAETMFKGAEMVEAGDPNIDLSEVVFFDSGSELSPSSDLRSQDILDINIMNVKEEQELIIEDELPININDFSDDISYDRKTFETSHGLRITAVTPASDSEEQIDDEEIANHSRGFEISLSDHLYAHPVHDSKYHCQQTIDEVLKHCGFDGNNKVLELLSNFVNIFEPYTDDNSQLFEYLRTFKNVLDIKKLDQVQIDEISVINPEPEINAESRHEEVVDEAEKQSEEMLLVEIKPHNETDKREEHNNEENLNLEIPAEIENKLQCQQQVESAVKAGQHFLDSVKSLQDIELSNDDDVITTRKKLLVALQMIKRDACNLANQMQSQNINDLNGHLSDFSSMSSVSSLNSFSSRSRRKKRERREKNVTSTGKNDEKVEINGEIKSHVPAAENEERDRAIERLLDFDGLDHKQKVTSKTTKTSNKTKNVKDPTKKTESDDDLDSDLGSSDDEASETSSSSSDESSDEEATLLKRQEEAAKEELLCDSSYSDDLSDDDNIDDLLESSEDERSKSKKVVKEPEKEETENKPEKSPVKTKSNGKKLPEDEKDLSDSSSDEESENKNPQELPSFSNITKKNKYQHADDKEIFSKKLLLNSGESIPRPSTSGLSKVQNEMKSPKPVRESKDDEEKEQVPELGVDTSMFKEEKKRKVYDIFERRHQQPKQQTSPKPVISLVNDDDEEVISLSSDTDSEVNSVTTETDAGKFSRRKKMLTDEELKVETKSAQKAEKERVERLKKKNMNMSQIMTERLSQGLSQGTEEELVLDFDKSDNPIQVHKSLVAKMKQHQKDGIKFMYDVCFGSLKDDVKTESGCILAHCMGLGKTFQLVMLVHTLITHKQLATKRILVICPKSTIFNWKDEFEKWLQGIYTNQMKIYYNPDEKPMPDRVNEIEKWFNSDRPGVFLINYEAFRNMLNYPRAGKPPKVPLPADQIERMQKTIYKCFASPGPDLVVCDEGHYIKNEKGATYRAVSQIETKRRIILTGTPLQNNLCEYWAMVSWIKPNFLGTIKEFNNQFGNPIKEGQHNDSTSRDIKKMKARSHILNQKLSHFVQRKDSSVLSEHLPEKYEYCIYVPITAVQEKLYKRFLKGCGEAGDRGHSLLNDYTALRKIWTHPCALKNARDRALKGEVRLDHKKKTSKKIDDEEEDDVLDKVDGDMGVKSSWFESIATPEDLESLYSSNKFILLFDILNKAQQSGEKVLIFSGFVAVLNIVEEFMKRINECYMRGEAITDSDRRRGLDKFRTHWIDGVDYIRLDGQTKRNDRQNMIEKFNNESNKRLRCFLISAKAGGQGINLTAANRCILLDTSWNPSSDLQNIFRIYRLGQKRTCYAYRFIASGTMEEKVYSRAVTKQAMSGRVVDKRTIDRHFKVAELQELYDYTPPDFTDWQRTEVPEDNFLKNLILEYGRMIFKCHSHDRLLEDKPDQGLTNEEIEEGWKQYEQEMTAPRSNAPTNPIPNTTDLAITGVGSMANLTGLLQLMHPSLTNPFQSYMDFSALSSIPSNSTTSPSYMFNNFNSLYPDYFATLQNDVPTTSKAAQKQSRKRKNSDSTNNLLKSMVDALKPIGSGVQDYDLIRANTNKQRKLDETQKNQQKTPSISQNQQIDAIRSANTALTISPIPPVSVSSNLKTSDSARTRYIPNPKGPMNGGSVIYQSKPTTSTNSNRAPAVPHTTPVMTQNPRSGTNFVVKKVPSSTVVLNAKKNSLNRPFSVHGSIPESNLMGKKVANPPVVMNQSNKTPTALNLSMADTSKISTPPRSLEANFNKSPAKTISQTGQSRPLDRSIQSVSRRIETSNYFPTPVTPSPKKTVIHPERTSPSVSTATIRATNNVPNSQKTVIRTPHSPIIQSNQQNSHRIIVSPQQSSSSNSKSSIVNSSPQKKTENRVKIVGPSSSGTFTMQRTSDPRK